MTEQYLHRGDAPFGDGVWERIDTAVIEAAKNRCAGRRLIHTVGPHGLGLKTLPSGDHVVDGKTVEGVAVDTGPMVPLAFIHSEFTLSIRDVAAHEQAGMPLDVKPAAKAAVAVARQEDQLVFNGLASLGTTGLLNTPGGRSIKLEPWEQVGTAAEDIIRAVNELDAAGFSGPYALALTPNLYNRLLRRYPRGNMTELEHVHQIATDGVIKVPGLPVGGVLVAKGGS
jgi:uncharacterized linocin/CFP29 family protein